MAKDMRSGFVKAGGSSNKNRTRAAIVEGAVKNAERPSKESKDERVGAKNIGKSFIVSRDRIRPNDYNYNRMDDTSFEKLKRNIEEFGFNDPLLVRDGNEKGKFPDGMLEIINGYHRWKGAEEVGLTELRVLNIGRVSDARAKAMTINSNELHGMPDHEALSTLLKEISESAPELTDLMPYSDAELNSMISAGASDLALLEQLHAPSPSDDEEGSSEDGDDDEEETDKVYDLLGLSEMEDEEYEKVFVDLTELNEKFGYTEGDGRLLQRMIRTLKKKTPN